MAKKNKNLERIGGFVGMTITTPLAGLAAQQVGNQTSIPLGIRQATQVGIGGGLLGQSLSLSSDLLGTRKKRRR